MALPRHSIEDFAIANDAYIGGSVTFFIAAPGGGASATKATLYSDLTGATVLPNPQTLNSKGFFQQPVYIDVDVVAQISAGAASGVTGVIGYGGANRSSWLTATRYFSRDIIIGPSGKVPDVVGNLYESTTIFDSTTWAADLAHLTLLLDYQATITLALATRAQINAAAGGLAMPADQFATSKFDATGVHLVPFGVGFAIDTSTAGGGPVPTNNVTGVNKIPYASIDFDQATQENVAWTISGPKSADEAITLTFKYRWTATAGVAAQGVVFGLSATGYGDGDPIDLAPTAAIKVTDNLTATGDVQISPVSAAVTVKNWAEGDTITFLFSRFPGDAGDTLAADAKIVAVDVFLTVNKSNDG